MAEPSKSVVTVSGLGAVSPAGWGVPALRRALASGLPLPAADLPRPGWQRPLRVVPVPAPDPRPAFLGHPRLRRASPITHYATAAVLECLGSTLAARRDTPPRLGLIVCVLTGCGLYTERFYAETLADPSTASPLIFPETVFNAPASHVGAFLGVEPVTYTLISDPAGFLQGLALAADWLHEGRVEACVVVGAEESNWLIADVLWQFDHRAALSGGAGAICLQLAPGDQAGVTLERITDPWVCHAAQPPLVAAQRMRQQLPAGSPAELLCLSTRGTRRADRAEELAWLDWPGPRLAPKTVLGEGLMAAGAWQCVAACDALAAGPYPAANLSLVGFNAQAIGARFLQGSKSPIADCGPAVLASRSRIL